MKRPSFLPIVSSVVLAQSMLKRASGQGPTKGIQGFVVELNKAGGHNAPPRGFRYDPVAKTHDVDLNERGEPLYGPKDDVDLLKFGNAIKGLPFWLAGDYGKPEKLKDVLSIGGSGIQCGTLFALTEESGLADDIKQDILEHLNLSYMDVFTDPAASPTGFPFKVLELEDSLSDKDTYQERPRVCNLGYLRAPYIKEDGRIGYRCPSEPVEQWIKKGGEEEATKGRKCLCNSLCSNAGFAQVTKVKQADGTKTEYVEKPLITIGDDVNSSKRFIKLNPKTGRLGYSAGEVVDWLKSEFEQAAKSTETEKANVKQISA
jgi:nitronate monooxygenase